MDSTAIFNSQINQLSHQIDSLGNVISVISQSNKLLSESIDKSNSMYINYLDILEKTNSQLSLWINPHALFVDSLGVLFAIAAILVGVVMFRQSHEYKRTLERFWEKNDERVRIFIAERKNEIDKIDELYVKRINELKLERDKISADQEDKIDKITKQIDELTLQKEASKFTNYSGVAAAIPFSIAPVLPASSGIVATCHKCGKSYPVVAGRQVSYCPFCGNTNS
jgi:hypothetical protein